MLKKTVKLKKLQQENKNSFFKQVFYRGELCRFNPIQFIIFHIKRLAEKDNVEVQFFSSRTTVYKEFGCNVFQIISCPGAKEFKEEKSKPVLFDPTTLMI